MIDRGATITIAVASLLERPRNLPPARAEAVYREGEALALGLDIALAARGVKRTNLLAQRVNRVAFHEVWAPPGGPAHWESVLLALDAGRPPPEPGAADPELAARRARIAAGEEPSRFPHLLGHAAAPWYAVPREFPRPFWITAPRPQSGAGASAERTLSIAAVPRLVAELEGLEPLLVAQGRDPEAWFPAPLLEATAVSLETGLLIIITGAELGTSQR